MSDTKFTPAPWSVNPVGPHWNNPEIAQYEITYSDAGECIVDHVYELADAHLIAESPAMYKEIEDDIKWLERLAKKYVIGSYELQGVLSRIQRKRELLAKARGE